jgi:hypothetical protein
MDLYPNRIMPSWPLIIQENDRFAVNVCISALLNMKIIKNWSYFCEDI